MPEVYSKALDKSIQVDRFIGKIKGSLPGPSLIFTGGIHGNEPSGVFALQQVMQWLEDKREQLKGNVYAISGNLGAMATQQRFHQKDLNRLWTEERVRMLNSGEFIPQDEDSRQQLEIHKIIHEIMDTDPGPYYFFDLHTTSSESVPFLTVNDSMLNRKYTLQYPLPIILGIEEFLDGPLLSYINELGYVAFAFEAGQHDDLSSIENQIAFIYLSLVFTGTIRKEDMPEFDHHFQVLAKTSLDAHKFFEIRHRHGVMENDDFKMNPGYVNFQPIRKGQELARSNGVTLTALRNGRIFMPLYQNQGFDGYFEISSIPGFFLQLSARLRKLRFDKLLSILPGVKWETDNHEALRVNRRVARLFTFQFFHLLGYRSKKVDANHYIMKNREEEAKNEAYKGAHWLN